MFTVLMRRLARWYLLHSWASRLPRGERLRLYYWGATGNPAHNDPCAWVFDK